MQRRSFVFGAAAAAAFAAPDPADSSPATITLPKPKRAGGKPLLDALDERKTLRAFAPTALPEAVLSNLLWAGFGVNRADGRRTAPTASNVQDIDLYVFLPAGVYTYDAAGNQLKLVVAGDHRGKVARPAAAPAAAAAPGRTDPAAVPLTIVYIADSDKYKGGSGRPAPDPARTLAYSNAHAGFIAQNVYLYAASEGLASSFRASLDADGLAQLLQLRPSQKPLYSHLVGYPAKSA